MDGINIEEKEIYTIDNKKYNVIVRVTNKRLSKDQMIKLIAKYGFSEPQVQAILGMTLRRLTGIETDKLEALKAHKKGLMQQLFPQHSK